MALIISGAAGASATTAGYSGQVDSGGAIKYFTNQRVSTQTVSNHLTAGNGGVTQGLYSCTDFSSIGVADVNFEIGDSKSYSSASQGKCFRIKMARTRPTDSNGILPGNGVTDVAGQLTY